MGPFSATICDSFATSDLEASTKTYLDAESSEIYITHSKRTAEDPGELLTVRCRKALKLQGGPVSSPSQVQQVICSKERKDVTAFSAHLRDLPRLSAHFNIAFSSGAQQALPCKPESLVFKDCEDSATNSSCSTQSSFLGPDENAHVNLQDPFCSEKELSSEDSEASDGSCAEDADEGSSFDPYLFMSQLPPREEVAPAGRCPCLPEKDPGCLRMTVVLDLDETLVHSCLDSLDGTDFAIDVSLCGQSYSIGVRQRPHLFDFLARASERFEVVVFTASQRVYAEKLLDTLDPGRDLVRHRLYREDCLLVDGNYVKDLGALGRDLRHTVLVDNSPHAFGYQPDNGIPIESWYDDEGDVDLLALLELLDELSGLDDVRPCIARRFQTRLLVESAAASAAAAL
uniref:CTD small phosphatase-like protein 2 n=1 Tax=Tetraselmis sp. GSL018 TaxID=582737 RepID=A0A061R5M4_9CHLO|mmetsp:Transcript_2330/g.5504  ORF Transcript_2330/g.5504 Transcript_2330/m.5504 type:complete len:400 (-) Transcript_2330:304-1503(-)|eukprot:CAMPEP_0177593696 /NCGR_PEP_ID=MMETSP0419_2-20121207/9317_1 /TAXON_ID=582737 /ORGANISM="Tetraselmis sp., Strain GSL018" /LENGTH=399 /DNA_ID=CAMNT_0019084819 /DNA_START=517 /DNA_END=1716 /DNA_ORIENTATION=+